MCGLVGLFRTGTNSTPIDQDLLVRMRDTMVHRGPDDQGVYVSNQEGVGLAHRRLSIIDLSKNAAQPMATKDKSLWIVFNGEIYNHMAIRKELEAKGHTFQTDHSDTETILKGYEEWGEEILPKLRGMFAFAIWDAKKKRMWIARDRIGIKPLYYTISDGMFIFASEIKALLAYPSVKRKVHDKAFYDFLTFLVSPAPQTLFEGIYKLPASSTLTVTADGKIEQKKYWNPFHGHSQWPTYSEEEWAEKILNGLRESIKYRMMSDVKFGVFLSGGIDSSANVALMAELMDRPVETFSIGFEDGGHFNELNYARMIVDRYKTNHHEFILTPEELVRFLPTLVHHQDEPIVDPVCVPVYYVSKLAKDNQTTVCQVGEGSDELYCGYPYWGKMLDFEPVNQAYQYVPNVLRNTVYGMADVALKNPAKGMRQLEVLRRATKGERIFWGGAEAYQETHKKRFLSPKFLKKMDGYSTYEPIQEIYKEFEANAPDGADTLHWMTYVDLRLRLPELLLMRVDKMTMATSVESRVPFLDHEFVSMSMGMPQTLKYKDKVLKYILKKAVEPVLPHENIYRKKQGFGVPVARWFRESLRDWSEKKIVDFSRRTDFFDPNVMEGFLRQSSSKVGWFLLNFVLWHEIWIEEKKLDLPV